MTPRDLLEAFFEEEVIMQLLGYSKKRIKNLRSLASRGENPHATMGTRQLPPALKVGSRWVYPKKHFTQWAIEHGMEDLVA